MRTKRSLATTVVLATLAVVAVVSFYQSGGPAATGAAYVGGGAMAPQQSAVMPATKALVPVAPVMPQAPRAPVAPAAIPANREAWAQTFAQKDLDELEQVLAPADLSAGLAIEDVAQELAAGRAHAGQDRWQYFDPRSPGRVPFLGERAAPPAAEAAEPPTGSKLEAAQATLAALLASGDARDAKVEEMVRAGKIDTPFQYVLLTSIADAETARDAARGDQLALVQRSVYGALSRRAGVPHTSNVLPAILQDVEEGAPIEAAVDQHLGWRDVAFIPVLRAIIDTSPEEERAPLLELMNVLTARAATRYEHARMQLETLLRLRAGEMTAALGKMVADKEIGPAFLYLLTSTLEHAERTGDEAHVALLQAIHEQLRKDLARKAIRDAYDKEMMAAMPAVAVQTLGPQRAAARAGAPTMMADDAFGASHTSMYTDAVAKDSYDMLPKLLEEKVADPDLRKVMTTMFNAMGTITEALRQELVTVAEEQSSVFGDVQLGVDVLADDLMWDVCKTEPLIKEGASEEEPEVRVMHEDGKFSIVWDPLDGSSIVDNNWAVGTILGIWDAKKTGILGATGRDQVCSMVALYGPRTTVYVTLDDGVYEFTYGANGEDGWVCSRDSIEIATESKIFSPGNLRATQEIKGYNNLVDYWMTNRYTMRYTGGLVPDICQQFTKKQGVFSNPTSEASPAKLRLAFEAAPFGYLVEKAGGKTSDGVGGGSILDVKITGIDQRTPLCIGSACEVDRFNELVLGKDAPASRAGSPSMLFGMNKDKTRDASPAEGEEEDGTKRLLQQVKDAGVAGFIAYALWEWGFWVASVPVGISAYYGVTGHFPDLQNPDDLKQLGAEAFAFVNVARFAVPLRIGLALGSVPWVEANVVQRIPFLKKKAEEQGA